MDERTPEEILKEITAEELLADYAPLSRKQYGMCRDGGFTAEELIGKDHDWYQLILPIIKYTNSKKMPALDRQIEFIKSKLKSCPPGLTYSKARVLIRKIEKMLGTDEKYLAYIANQEKREDSKKTPEAKEANRLRMATNRSSQIINVDEPFGPKTHDAAPETYTVAQNRTEPERERIIPNIPPPFDDDDYIATMQQHCAERLKPTNDDE